MTGEKRASFAQFFYRINPDKTTDSICGFCFLTAATARNRAELQALEATHNCRSRSHDDGANRIRKLQIGEFRSGGQG
jgi:hypothetical protein